ncbi:hypothetical protein GCM10010372_84490 [Streptomyces tauricus]|nr:hypothetical protein GCM10010372_84490 [Streptomyces tauricus]
MGAHNVRRHGSGTKQFHHHEVGDLTLTYEGMELTAEPGLSLLIYTYTSTRLAQPGAPATPREPCRNVHGGTIPHSTPDHNQES